MKPLVSILIPAYNAADWIADTIESAQAQTWERKEIIIVDDGSRDRTLEVARRFESNSVKVVTQPNQGAAAARNAAFALSQGNYIQWLDADDLLDPGKITRQMDAVEQYPSKRTLFSSEWAYFFHRFDRAEFVPSALWCDLSPVEWLTRKMGQNLHMQPDSWLVSRELTQAAGPWDVRLWRDNDGEYFCRVILASDAVRFVAGAKSYYRRSGNSSVSYIGRSNRKLESLFRSMQLHIGYLRSLEGSPRTRKACLTYLQTWLHHFYPDRMDIVEQIGKLARELGGELQPPKLSWKYSWIQKLFGWSTAKQVQLLLPSLKEKAMRSCDRFISS